MSAPTDLTDKLEGDALHEEAEEEARLADAEQAAEDPEEKFVETLRELLWEQYNDAEEDGPLVEVEDIASFEELGYMTRDRGLRLRLANGAQFDLTVTCIEEPEARLAADEEAEA